VAPDLVAWRRERRPHIRQEEVDMANGKKPNILVIFGDDIGMWNLSCYSSGMMSGAHH
jgi:arylsulfatase A-like enzyme